jgi:hypothetical protein
MRRRKYSAVWSSPELVLLLSSQQWRPRPPRHPHSQPPRLRATRHLLAPAVTARQQSANDRRLNPVSGGRRVGDSGWPPRWGLGKAEHRGGRAREEAAWERWCREREREDAYQKYAARGEKRGDLAPSLLLHVAAAREPSCVGTCCSFVPPLPHWPPPASVPLLLTDVQTSGHCHHMYLRPSPPRLAPPLLPATRWGRAEGVRGGGEAKDKEGGSGRRRVVESDTSVDFLTKFNILFSSTTLSPLPGVKTDSVVVSNSNDYHKFHNHYHKFQWFPENASTCQQFSEPTARFWELFRAARKIR